MHRRVQPSRGEAPAAAPDLAAPQLTARTCRSAASSRACLETESLQTRSHRVLSSSICFCSHWESTLLLPRVRSRTERFSILMQLARLPSSFWKT